MITKSGPRVKILVVEDDKETLHYIAQSFEERGDSVDSCSDGREALLLSGQKTYDVMIVDRMLPELDGLSFVQEIRKMKVSTPVLFLSALGSIEQRVEGLEEGGDDYLVKPFALSELYARVCSLARRPSFGETLTSFESNDLKLNLLKREVYRAGQKIELNPMEFKLLEFLMRKKGQVVTRSMLLENVWGFDFDPKTNVVETHLSRLRGKVDKGFGTELIRTVRGAGYILDE